MIIILKRNADVEKVNQLKEELKAHGLQLHLSEGTETTIIGLVGDTSHISENWLSALDVVEGVRRIREPYKKANRSMHPEDTVIDVCGCKIGGGNFQVIAGPCSIETKEQITEVAFDVKNSGAKLLRGGAFKPRTSPYSFQGLGRDGLDLLLEAKKATGLPVVTEIMRLEHLEGQIRLFSADSISGKTKEVYLSSLSFFSVPRIPISFPTPPFLPILRSLELSEMRAISEGFTSEKREKSSIVFTLGLW